MQRKTKGYAASAQERLTRVHGFRLVTVGNARTIASKSSHGNCGAGIGLIRDLNIVPGISWFRETQSEGRILAETKKSGAYLELQERETE